ncbi:MAG: hypothetical protein HY721_06630 [Planctomycetes bacterium]|nr:hypothetical protein [Planctomycetota bacterium]
MSLPASCVLLAGMLTAADPLPPGDGVARMRDALGASRFQLEELALPVAELPEAFELEVPIDGVPSRLLLRRQAVRAAGFRLLVQEAGGRLVEAPAPPERAYRGEVASRPGAIVAGSLLPEGFHGRVIPAGGAGWSVRPLREVDPAAPRSRHAVFAAEDEAPFACGTEDNESSEAAAEGAEGGADSGDEGGAGGGGEVEAGAGAGAGSAGGAACTLTEAEIAFDSDYEFFDRAGGGSAETCLEIVETGLNITNAIYVRDVKITHRLTTLVVRSDPAADFWRRFPDASDFGAMLGAFRGEWNANMQGVRRDVAYYLTAKSNPNYGGLAFVGVVCTSSHYGMGIGSRGYEGIFRHEVGHNWGAGHTCGTERRFIMCGNSIPAISAYNIRVMAAHRDSRSCLVEVPNDSPPGTPYVRLDRVVRFVDGGPVAIDPASGDTDSGCGPLRLVAHDARSAFGAAILPLGPLAPGGPDALLYVPRSDLHGTDFFGYTVADGDGNERAGSVLVESRPRELIVHLKLDETSGADAADSSGAGHDGELRGDLTFDAASVPGRHGRALKLSGIDGEYLSLGNDAAFDLPEGLTVALWLRFDALGAAGGESLVAKGGDAWRLKRDGTAATLRLTLTGVQVGGTSSSDLRGTVRVDDGAWHHAVAVYDGSRAALYMDGELDREVPASGRIRRNSSSLRIGDELFNGAVDEVRIYDFGLDADAARALYADARIERADPPDGKSGVVPGAKLTWLAAPSASAYDIYLGTDLEAVLAAGPGSPEHLGRVTAALFGPALELDRTYRWRVDPVVGGTLRRGEVRRFSTSFAYTDFDEPAINAASYAPGPAARELGFVTTSTPTGGESPFAGVIDTSSTPTTPIFSHRSVRAETAIGPADLAGRSGAAVSMILQARDSGYEEDQDWVEVRATDGAESVRLVRLDGGNALTQRAGTGYQTFAGLLPAGWARASLVVSSSSNSSSGEERYDIDQVGFFCRRPFESIAYSRFEEPPQGAATYTPPAGAQELGFQTQSAPAGASPFAGVEEEGSVLASRHLAHRSVRATTTFGAVDLQGREAVEATVTVRVRDTGYEADDRLEIVARSGAEQVTLVRLAGDAGLSDLAGEYASFRAPIPASWASVTIAVTTATNSSTGAEGIDLRLVEVTSRARLDACEEEPPPPPPDRFRRGDANSDGRLDLSDGIRILNYLFLGGVALECLDAGDTDDGGAVDLSDGVRIFNHLFLGGAPPAAPGPTDCGPDPSEDELACEGGQGGCG